MNVETGVFTTPVRGKYSFSFVARADSAGTRVDLLLNDEFLYATSMGASVGDTMTLHYTNNLNEGSNISVRLTAGSIYGERESYYTHFTGFLLG